MRSTLQVSAVAMALIVSTIAHDGAKAQSGSNDRDTKTKLETFTGNVGVVSIKGYVEVGSIGSLSNPVRVTAMIVRDAKTGKETSGAVFEIAEPKSYGMERARSYVDADELADLLSGLTYISQIDETATPMRFFEAQYSTRGGLRMVVFNNAEGRRQFSVHVGGTLGGKDVYFLIQDLPNFWDLVAKAKEVIENPQRLGKMQPTTSLDTSLDHLRARAVGSAQSPAPPPSRTQSTGKKQ